MNHRVIIALGSNYLQAAHIQWASQCMQSLLDDCQFTRTIWTKDIKGTDKMYQNRLVFGTTTLSSDDLQAKLKTLEAATCRTKSCVTIDLDLMLYDQQRFHEKDWERPYFTILFDEQLQTEE